MGSRKWFYDELYTQDLEAFGIQAGFALQWLETDFHVSQKQKRNFGVWVVTLIGLYGNI